VGIGTDMDGISPPSFLAYDDYSEWPSIGAALLARGRSREDVAKVVGGTSGGSRGGRGRLIVTPPGMAARWIKGGT